MSRVVTNNQARKLRQALMPSSYGTSPYQWGYVAAVHTCRTTTLSANAAAGAETIKVAASIEANAQIQVGSGAPVSVGSVSGSGPYTLELGSGIPFAASSGATVRVIATVDVFLDGWQNAPSDLPAGVTPTPAYGVSFLSDYSPIVGHVVLIARAQGLSRSDRVVVGPPSAFSTSWIAPAFAGGWSNYGTGNQTLAYRRLGEMVQIRGTIKGGSGTIFTLPTGYMPSATESFVCSGDSAFAGVAILANGVVELSVGSASSLLVLGHIQFSVQ